MKKTSVISLILLIAMVLSSCGQAVNSENEETNNEITIKTVSMFGGTDPNATYYEAICEQFLADNPNYRLIDSSRTADEEWKTSIAADFSAGNEPDVIQFFTDATANQIVAMDKFVTVAEIREVYPEYAADILDYALKTAENMDGVLRAVPTTGYWEGLYCNKDLFDKYNVELPTDWDMLVNAINVFKENGIVPIACSLSNVPHYWMEYLMLYSAGAKGYETVPETAPDEWAAGLEVFKTLRDMGAFPEDTDIINNDYASQLFIQKKAAMQLEGNWFLAGIPDQENTVVIPFPGVPEQNIEPGAMVSGNSIGFYITRKAWNNPEKREAAVKFVMANTSREAIQHYWENGGAVARAAADVLPVDESEMTPLAVSAKRYIEAATVIVEPTDSRLEPEAYKTLIAGIVKVSQGSPASELIEEALRINANAMTTE